MRKIPTSMATQHPDNACKPFWHHSAYISTSEEILESYLCFSKFDIDEYNWDWEGKFVDEAVTDRFLHQYFDYFSKHPLGKDKFLTFRIPNPRVEKQFRLARAFMVIITSSQLAKSLGIKVSPIFETILPLTETAEEIIEIQQAFRDLTGLKHKLLNMSDSLKNIEIIPLFEQVSKIIASDKLILKYLSLHKKRFGYLPTCLRPYCARSDPALNSGLVPTMLAVKVALSSYIRVEKNTGVKLYPTLGTGSLPFRGGITPENIDKKINEYAGVSTLIIQSAFRYDYPLKTVKKGIQRIKTELPKAKAKELSPEIQKLVIKIIPFFANPYRQTIENIAPFINMLSSQVGRRRERMLHIGLFGYSRGMGKVTLPRAIPFTAALYSIGVPPELIGTGRGITKAKRAGIWKDVSPIYYYLKDDLMFAGSYFNRENLLSLSKESFHWQEVLKDIEGIEKEYGIILGPVNSDHYEHKKITKNIFDKLKQNKEVTELITCSGILRRSLG